MVSKSMKAKKLHMHWEYWISFQCTIRLVIVEFK